MQTQVMTQRSDGGWDPHKTYPNPLLAYIAAGKLSRERHCTCVTVCASGQMLDEVQPF